jgi:4-amino-4-deoxy-L-arabinose transferase-like glycosyltransferase
MSLKPEASIMVGLAVAALVHAIYQGATPPLTDIRSAEPGDPDVDSAERTAAWTAAGAVSGVSLIAKDPTIFVIGGAMVIVESWWRRHGNLVDPAMGLASAVGIPWAGDDSTPDELADVS